MGILLAIVLPPSHESTAITDMKVHVVPTDAGYMVVLFLWLQVTRVYSTLKLLNLAAYAYSDALAFSIWVGSCHGVWL